MRELAKGVGTADADHATPALHGEALAGWRLAGDAPGSVFYGDAALRDAVSLRGGVQVARRGVALPIPHPPLAPANLAH